MKFAISHLAYSSGCSPSVTAAIFYFATRAICALAYTKQIIVAVALRHVAGRAGAVDDGDCVSVRGAGAAAPRYFDSRIYAIVNRDRRTLL